jgi:hypothetical protein
MKTYIENEIELRRYITDRLGFLIIFLAAGYAL